jgi:hypothetical protein
MSHMGPSSSAGFTSARVSTVAHCVTSFSLGAALLAMASGCSVDTSGEDALVSDAPSAAAKDQHVFGGELATEERYDAVGAIALKRVYEIPDQEPIVYYDPLCSGTLVDEKAILTARHCTTRLASEMAAGTEAYFLIGQNVWEPEQVVPIVSWREAPASPSHPGLLYDGGRDVAVAYLGSCVKGVRPAEVGDFERNSIGKQFEIAGFGYNDSLVEEYGFYDIGTKFKGTVTARALSGPWYDLLFQGDYDAYFEWYMTDAVTNTPSPEEAAAWWTAFTLEPGYELLAGGLPGESLGCFGDSGGPLLTRAKKNKKNLTVVGVSFAVESSQATLCTRGGGYAIMNREMKRFVDSALRHH